MSAEDSQNLQVPPDQLDFAKVKTSKSVNDMDDDDHDLFKSAMEVSPTD
jgi:hypothetical protein